jgi:hypothetical protein
MSKYIKRAASLLPQVTREVSGAKPVDMMGDYTRDYKAKVRFAMLGGVAKGKSTVAAALVVTLQNLSALDPNFFARVLPTSSHILSEANNLRLGKFPEKTDPSSANAPEAGILICEKGSFGDKRTQIPVCDMAGEITDYIEAKSSGLMPSDQIRDMATSINMQMYNTAKACQGIIVILSAEDSLLYSKGPQDKDQDVYTHNALTAIFEYRRKNHMPEPYVIVILTKWDQVAEKSKLIGMNVYDENGEINGLARFFDNGYPATSMLLKPLKEKGRVKFFRSWFTQATDDDGNVLYWPGTSKPRVKVLEDANSYLRYKPAYAEEDYINLVRYIGSFGQ